MKRVLALVVLFALGGCSLPQWRVFQKTVPRDEGPTQAQVESQRRAAALIVDLSADPTANPIARIGEIHAVAVPLSASLGEPLKRATVFEVPQVIAASRAALLEEQAKAEKWREFARKYGGKELEDTGINLAGPAGLIGLVAVVAACVACPALGYLLLRVVPLLWSFFSRTTSAVAELAKDNPDAATALASKLSAKMDAAHKRLVKLRAERISDIVVSKPTAA